LRFWLSQSRALDSFVPRAEVDDRYLDTRYDR